MVLAMANDQIRYGLHWSSGHTRAGLSVAVFCFASVCRYPGQSGTSLSTGKKKRRRSHGVSWRGTTVFA
jgi:hypothetical protein